MKPNPRRKQVVYASAYHPFFISQFLFLLVSSCGLVVVQGSSNTYMEYAHGLESVDINKIVCMWLRLGREPRSTFIAAWRQLRKRWLVIRQNGWPPSSRNEKSKSKSKAHASAYQCNLGFQVTSKLVIPCERKARSGKVRSGRQWIKEGHF